jgi:SNF2 family DNA or RNA helicase
VFIGNMRAAGSGIELFNATNVIFINLPFIPAEFEQAVDRLHRIGQKNVVNIYMATVTQTIDERIYKLMSAKMRDITTLMDGKTIDMNSLNIAEVLADEIINRKIMA